MVTKSSICDDQRREPPPGQGQQNQVVKDQNIDMQGENQTPDVRLLPSYVQELLVSNEKDEDKKVKMSVVDVEVQGFEQPLGQVLVSNGVSSRKEVIQWFNC